MELNFLQLVQRAHQESGVAGNGPTAVTGQVGRAADFVRWVGEVHEEIQLQEHWRFDWVQGIFTLTAGKAVYVPTGAAPDFGIAQPGVRTWAAGDEAFLFRPAQGINQRFFIKFVPWDEFKMINIPVSPGMPTCWTVDPTGSVRYFPQPEQSYTAYHEYWRKPQALAAATDVPRMPQEYHMGIVWKAVMRSCEKIKDWTRFDSAEENWNRIYNRMLEAHGPTYLPPGPWA